MASPAANSSATAQDDQKPPEDHKDIIPNSQNFDPQRRQMNRFRRRGGGPGPSFNPRFNNPRGRGGRNFNNRPWQERKDEADGEQNDFKELRIQDKLIEKLAAISGPAIDLPPLDTVEKKFLGRNRLYIGNLSADVTEQDLAERLSKCGEFAELFLNKEKNFAFVKFDYYASCEKAKRELDGQVLKGKNLKIRFAPNNASIKVKNLSDFVSNELLNYAFQVFGEVERANVLVDERGKPTGEGIVEFARKGCALHAIRKCSERCFFLTESLRPVVVEPYEYVNDTDGFPEKYLPRRNPDYLKARSKGPRLAELNSFEHEYGVRWKQLLDLYAQKEEALRKELHVEKEKLDAQMEYARYEHETEMLREELRARELDRERQKQEWEMKERKVEEQRRRNEEQIRRQEETLQARMLHQDEEMRRRQQENNLFMQAHQLHNILDEQEQAFQDNKDGFDEANEDDGNMRGNAPGFRRDRWITDRRDDFAPKRRRF
ncbi:NOPS and/or RRM 1 domain containing protein [Asbolus verrucosus]|uniref:NOPS and/or RRM 1 domain containing protein n=1 Tax=Asbolus verrucosus TaxID=1661398 RepID=A0A482W2W7_ASBVE|nr:NOPS and/or RRM 1 domain containing protein [Asbolus verrucosus]